MIRIFICLKKKFSYFKIKKKKRIKNIVINKMINKRAVKNNTIHY